MPPDLKDLGRFADPSLYVLVSLAEGEKHGYAIMQDVERLSGRRLGPGTLYSTLARLQGRGLIEALEPDERRRPYRLTEAGSRAIAAQLATLNGFVRVGLGRLERAQE
jgi:DNA-binding PadR family transcriptional regulator